MSWMQCDLVLRPRPRGCHLVTDEVVAGLDLSRLRIGLCQIFLRHSSAALTLNENADPDVRSDCAAWLDRLTPSGDPAYRHRCEGDDDLPAHLQCSLLGCSLLIPVRAGALALGTWQGIWLVEGRIQGGPRQLLLTAWGE